MNITELAALIAVRDFTYQSIDNIRIKIDKGDIKTLIAKLPIIDEQIVKAIVNLNLSTLRTNNENTK